MTTKRTQANLNWNKNNPERRKYLNYRTMARSFIRKLATPEDLEELTALIKERQQDK